MGTARAPVSESGRWPACSARVANPKVCSASDPSGEVLGVVTVSAMMGSCGAGGLDRDSRLFYEILRRMRAGIHVCALAQFVAGAAHDKVAGFERAENLD